MCKFADENIIFHFVKLIEMMNIFYPKNNENEDFSSFTNYKSLKNAFAAFLSTYVYVSFIKYCIARQFKKTIELKKLTEHNGSEWYGMEYDGLAIERHILGIP